MASGATAQLQVIATGVYEHVLKDLAEPFAARAGKGVSFIITNAGGVIAKLDADATADVVMTSSAGIDSLAAKGRVIGASKVDVGGMRLGVAVKSGAPVPDIKTSDALREVLRNAPAVASIDPHGGGTSGPFIDRLFERLGVAEVVRSNGVLCATGADVVRAVASGRASLGMTQAAELIGLPGLAFAGFVPDELQLVTVYSAAVAASSKIPDAAAAFIAFITGPEAVARLRSSGWDAPP
ncbi:MAG TPA: substrate-binding domain-containing protein [Xanthobacteraceae bacterium]|jgi:molybdate transport system substrate-binding protein